MDEQTKIALAATLVWASRSIISDLPWYPSRSSDLAELRVLFEDMRRRNAIEHQLIRELLIEIQGESTSPLLPIKEVGTDGD